MDHLPGKNPVTRLWGRRWVRRISYLVVAGATAMTVGPWILSRPTVMQWGVRKLDALLQDETGLSLLIGRVELHPFSGTVTLQNIHLGNDLLTIQRIDILGDPWSLFSPTRHLLSIRVLRPRLRLTEAGLASLRLKPHPPRQGPLPKFRLDTLSLLEGQVDIPVAFRGIPPLQFQFEVKGTGLGPNDIRLALPGGRLTVQSPAGLKKGRFDLNAELSETSLRVHEAYLRLGENQVRVHGGFVPAPSGSEDRLEADLTGTLDLAEMARMGGLSHSPISGNLDIRGALKGSPGNPAWTFSADGQNLAPTLSRLKPGDLTLKLHGTRTSLRLESLHWASVQGLVAIQGNASSQGPTQAEITAERLDLGALGSALRIQELQGVKGHLQGKLLGPSLSQPLDHLDSWTGDLTGSLDQHGRQAGGFKASLAKNRVDLTTLNLALDQLQLEGSGWATFNARGLLQTGGEGETALGAAQVARALSAWKIVDLDMDGQTKAAARFRWDQRRGFSLDGSLTATQPRWHGAVADSLTGKVAIQDSELKVTDIQIEKDQGRGTGELWLTWAPTEPGQPQVDMCYTAFRLPVLEGLKAADQGDLPISGQGSGWARLHGPYDRLLIEGAVQVEDGQAYGLKLPASSSDFRLDLSDMRLRLDDLRLAEEPRLLGHGDTPPEGALALHGRADMNLNQWTWLVDLSGRIDSQALALPGPRVQAKLEAHLLGPITSPLGSLDLPEGRLGLDQGRIFFGDHTVDGLKVALQREKAQVQVQASMDGHDKPILDLRIQQKGLALVGDLTGDLSPETAKTSDLARSLTNDFLQDLNLKVAASGKWENQTLTWQGSLERMAARFQAFELHQTAPASLQGNALGAYLDLTLAGSGLGEPGITTPETARVRLSGTVPFLPASPMAIHAQGSLSLPHLKTILDRIMEVDDYSVLSELSLQGEGQLDIQAHGTYAEPLLDGTLSLINGRINLRGYQGAEDLSAQIILKDRTLSIPADRPLRGTLAHGELAVTGLVSWKPGGLDTYDLKAALRNFQLRDVPVGLDLQGSLQATLTGQEGSGLLKGRLQADHLNYQSEVKLADLILRSALSDSGGMAGLELDDPLDAIQLDLDLDLQEPWHFDTNLLKLAGQTEGPFQVVGTLAHPVPKGTMIFQPGGRLTNIFPAGDMVVDRGSLVFSESRPLDPLISIQGSVSSIPGYTVNLDIRGTLSNLSITPTSTPSLRQDEIVAILINPGNVANVGSAGTSSATQGALTSGLASASSGILTTLAFTPFQEQLRRALGLDRVNVAVRTTSLGTTETEFTVGKSMDLFGQRSALVISHKKSGELSITSGQIEWRFGNLILQLGGSKGGTDAFSPSGEIRHTWSPK